MKHLLSISDLTLEEIEDILKMAGKLKEDRYRNRVSDYLRNKSLAMIFEHPSTRTRISFEVAMADLGGHALYLSWNDLQLGRGETIKDTAMVMARYVHGVVIRARKHETVEEFARYSERPVINGLSDLEHPCQVLSDLFTIGEYKGNYRDLTITWVGDGNNVCNSLVLASAIVGMKMVVSTPDNYRPREDIIKKAKEAYGGDIVVEPDPKKAVENADIIYTDVWVSMGMDNEKEDRIRNFKGYQVNQSLVDKSKDDVIVMHCLPAHRGEEITSEVLEGTHSVVLDQAENRLHVQKAILVKLMSDIEFEE
jgi:ornithine carbamoyltransferase